MFMGQCNVMMRPLNVNRGPCNVIMGLSNVNRGPGM